MEVIDIPSSPELLPTIPRPTHNQSQQPGSQKRSSRLPLPPAPTRWTEEIIDISDSDSEPEYTLSSLGHRRLVETQAVPGPSKLPAIGAPRHGGLLAGAAPPAAGSSQQPLRNQIVATAPLFYSDDEDTELQQEPMLTPQLDIHSAPVLPPVPLPQPSHPPEPPAEAQTTTDACVARVLEIVPDVEPGHVLGLTEHFIHNPVTAGQNSIERESGKRPEDDEEGAARGQPVPKIDYGATNREFTGGIHYFELALEQLMVDFPYAPKPYLRAQLLKQRFYAPLHLFLAEKRDPLPYVPKSVPSRSDDGFCSDWIRLSLLEHSRFLIKQTTAMHAKNVKTVLNAGAVSLRTHLFDQMVQCPEAHLFCKSCMSSYASNLLGEHNPNIVCMDQSGCKLLFPHARTFEAAGLENLEECPFCDYKCVIENEMEKLFRCENVDCGAVSCRECKKPDHLPKSCKEVESDKQLDVQHIVEEAMTRALMRNCPKCQKAFIKEYGCNKMTCPNCRTVSCYICREVIKGYEHFGRINPGLPYNARFDKNKCQLWDPVEQLHATEVQEAAKKAIEELKRDRPDVDESAIKVDIPVAGPARPVPNMNVNLNIHPPILNMRMRQPMPNMHPLHPVNAVWALPALPALPNANIHAYDLPLGGNMPMGNVHAPHAQQRMLEAPALQRMIAQRIQARAQLQQRMVQAQLAQAEARRQAVVGAGVRDGFRLMAGAERGGGGRGLLMPPQLPPAPQPQPVAAPRRSQGRG
ncbi:hypothetical protein EDD22DRAFT_959526 [Suillus occidentalis]|nr:hypothetical protein EDD22DRAFT_959526 [Suillus occidentalis]